MTPVEVEQERIECARTLLRIGQQANELLTELLNEHAAGLPPTRPDLRLLPGIRGQSEGLHGA